ncbi:MAG: SDR family oxidoreductase [Streptosporangiales bacterium]|nr:SDR family oxidoreductase [Streptosporangiales bacterium]
MLDLFRLDGRVAAVTGANSGIGRAAAGALAGAGADVAYISRRDPAEAVVDATAEGRRAVHVPLELAEADEDRCAAVVGEVVDRLGRLDILVNNAGTIHRDDAEVHRVDDFARILQLDLTALYGLCRAAGRHFLRQGSGRIINIASVLSFQGGVRVRVPGYTAAKHGVVGVTRALANEWAGRGVNVNAIAPGYLETNNTISLQQDPERYAAILDRIPAGRWGVPADIAGAAVFLASDASGYVHGAVLAVDGGWLAR